MSLEVKEITLLTGKEFFGRKKDGKKMGVIEKYGPVSAITDLALLTGGFCVNEGNKYNAPDDKSLKGRGGHSFTRDFDSFAGDIKTSTSLGYELWEKIDSRSISIRPVLLSDDPLLEEFLEIKEGYNGTKEVEYGEYPQYAPDINIQKELEEEYKKNKLKKTGKSYTFNGAPLYAYKGFEPLIHEEYEYDGKKYVRVQAKTKEEEDDKDNDIDKIRLSNGWRYKDGDNVWVEVSPIVWLVDEETKTLVSKRNILSGIRFQGYKDYIDEDFSRSEMSKYLNEYMLPDMTQSIEITQAKKNAPDEKRIKERKNPYAFEFKEVSEEDIIKGAIISDVPVFLHGRSSEGKSARVKQIDSNCEIVYLRNATPESLNGKSVYNPVTAEMMDIKPSWLKRLEKKCADEPDKLHVLFLDEITNALPSIQGIAFNIVLDKEVNGIWKLPENVRIVAAGNDMKDSLAANQLAEPLFNRFAHVYIKTTLESWLEWAINNNIHPAIICFMICTNGRALRTPYDGEKPNADPRKWEMSSNLLYKVKNPEMLRALLGEEVTREFVHFCKLSVITLEDVINKDYYQEEIDNLNTAERYATVAGLSRAKEENLEEVRDFAKLLGPEFIKLFDALWTRNDESRLERLAEAKLADSAIRR